MCKALIILFSSPPVTKDSQQFGGTESSLQEVRQDSSEGWFQPQRSLRGGWVLCQDHVMVQFSLLLNLVFSPFPLYVLIPCVLPKYISFKIIHSQSQLPRGPILQHLATSLKLLSLLLGGWGYWRFAFFLQIWAWNQQVNRCILRILGC